MASPGGSVVKSAYQCRSRGDAGLSPGSGRSPGGENSNPLQYTCLENPMDRAACQATVHGVTGSRTRLCDWVCTHVTYATDLEFVDLFTEYLFSAYLILSTVPGTEDTTVRSQKRGLFSRKKKSLFFSYHCKTIQELSKDAKTIGWKIVKEINIHMFSKYRY